MLRSLSISIETMGPSLPTGSDVNKRSSLISSGSEADLTNPVEIINTLSRSVNDLKLLQANPTFTEDDLDDKIISNSSILLHLLPVAVDTAVNDKKSPSTSLPWHRRRNEARAVLLSIRNCLEGVMKSDLFSLEKAEAFCLDLRQAEEGHNRALSRIKTELLDDARVTMCTIGSSHKIPVVEEGTDDITSLESKLGRMHLNGDSGKETIVVFDEAGCIPAYELLGLSRLNRNIKALICVGDKHQLPPYSPSSMKQKRNSFSRQPSDNREVKVDSLLDVSALEDDGDRGGKITLNTQYRVPRDIANVLNERIYRGNYCTPASCSVPSRGFHFVHVEYSHGGKKYENENEVKKCVELVTQYQSSGESMMVLTPVSAISFSLKQRRKVRLTRIIVSFSSTKNSSANSNTRSSRTALMKVGYLCSRSINAKVEKLIWCFSVSPADQHGFSTSIVSTWRSPVSARGSFSCATRRIFNPPPRTRVGNAIFWPRICCSLRPAPVDTATVTGMTVMTILMPTTNKSDSKRIF